MEKFLDELILSERKKRKEKVLDKQIDLERDLPAISSNGSNVRQSDQYKDSGFYERFTGKIGRTKI